MGRSLPGETGGLPGADGAQASPRLSHCTCPLRDDCHGRALAARHDQPIEALVVLCGAHEADLGPARAQEGRVLQERALDGQDANLAPGCRPGGRSLACHRGGVEDGAVSHACHCRGAVLQCAVPRRRRQLASAPSTRRREALRIRSCAMRRACITVAPMLIGRGAGSLTMAPRSGAGCRSPAIVSLTKPTEHWPGVAGDSAPIQLPLCPCLPSAWPTTPAGSDTPAAGSGPAPSRLAEL